MGRTKYARDDMIKAARDILSEDGATHLTIAGVAERIGSTKGAILHWFPTKDALVEALLAHLCADWDGRFDALSAGKSESALQTYLRVAESEDRLRPAYAAAITLALAESPAKITPVREAYDRYSRAILAEAAASQDHSAYIIRWLACEGLSLLSTFRLLELPTEIQTEIFRRLKEVDERGDLPANLLEP